MGASALPAVGTSRSRLDIEMVISMAPGVAGYYIYEAPNPSPWVDLLNAMATHNPLSKQLSCSWGGGAPDATSEQVFKQMAAQGQSFFNATGDSDAFTGSIPFPSDSTNITEVGGTTLTTGAGGAYSSETVWNWGGGQGSSGGISTYYAIPSYQQGISMAANQGSTTMRNVPDVALTANNVYVIYGNGSSATNYGGTSFAAPLWAGFTALVNQQAAAAGQTPVGFLNPALYTIGKGANYATAFHDTTTGNNFSRSSRSKFSAVAGYDLCTGWGTPNGTNLINALTLPPTVDFTGTPTNGAAPLTVSFTNLSTGANSYNWTLGDGHTSTNVNPANTYSNAGTYSVALTAIGAGGTDTLARIGYIVVVAPAVRAAGTVAYYPTNYPASALSANRVGNVTMSLTGDTNLTVVTLADGSYGLSNISVGGTYCVTPSKTNDSPAANGVDVLDLIAIARHITGGPFAGFTLQAAGCRRERR